ncbi:MAG TPA: radical SAM protein [Gammaproteobacteria bacterium]|nr:radical SAM protein [Gammaproteobacteria bacterium]
MDSLAYSQTKVAWHLGSIETLRRRARPVPVHVQLVLSDLCNQSCVFCAYRMPTGLSSELFVTAETINPNRKIPTSKAVEIIQDCASLGVKAIQFTGGGEPTVHKDHEAMFALAQDLGMQTALVTNGVKLKPTPAFLGMTWTRVSVDAGTPETYARIRGVSPDHWTKVWNNIATYALSFNGVLGVGFVVTNENWREIPEAARRAKESGAQNMRIGAVFSTEGEGYYVDDLTAIKETIEQAKTACDGDGFELINLFGRRIGDLVDGSPTDPFCGYQHFTTYIGADLNVYRCCNTAYTKAGTIASLKDQRLTDVLPIRDEFDARGCRACQFLGQNRAIASLIREPTHAAFV